MLDIKIIRENPEKIKQACQNKQVEVDIDGLLKIDQEKRSLIKENEELKSEHNKLSQKIALVKGEEKQELINQAKNLVKKIQSSSQDLEEKQVKFEKLIRLIPNPPLEEVKKGKGEQDNRILRKWGKIPRRSFVAQDHVVLGEKLDLIDTKRAAQVSGSRFAYLKNKLVLLEFALIQFSFNFLTQKGFTPILPPTMIKKEPMAAMGYLERGEEEVYRTVQDNLYLVGTGEQSVGPMHMNEILDELPRRYVAFSSCFRREAGSYGRDVKGILRVHQFDKIEMFSFSSPLKSREEHQFLLSLEEKLVQLLKIPYQVMDICSGDLGDPAAAKYDIECWLPGQKRYRETHSTSNCTDFQSRRLNIRFRNSQGQLEYVHTLNGTVFALGRILIAIMENYQQADGSIKVPKVLQKYTGFKKVN
jgi:seryl-tRNA synthetase